MWQRWSMVSTETLWYSFLQNHFFSFFMPNDVNLKTTEIRINLITAHGFAFTSRLIFFLLISTQIVFHWLHCSAILLRHCGNFSLRTSTLQNLDYRMCSLLRWQNPFIYFEFFPFCVSNMRCFIAMYEQRHIELLWVFQHSHSKCTSHYTP